MANDLVAAAADIKKLRRSMRLREETDPDVVAKTLETILRENVAVRSVDNGALGKNAAREIRDIRNALVANQVNAGSRQTDLIGKFTAITDQFNEIDENDRKYRSEHNLVNQSFGSLKDSIPSADALASAMMTANPLLGYAFRTLNNIRKGRQESKRRAEQEAKKRLSVLQKQQSVIQEQIGNEQKAEEVVDDSQKLLEEAPADESGRVAEGNEGKSPEKPQTEPKRRNTRGVYTESLMAIQAEIKTLNDFLRAGNDMSEEQMDSMISEMADAKQSSKDSILELQENLEEAFSESLANNEDHSEEDNQQIISALHEVPESINDKLQEIIDNGNKESRLERDRKNTEGLLSRENDYKNQNKHGGGSLLQAANPKSGLPILGMLGGLLGAGAGILSGAVASVAGFARKILGPFVGLLDFLKKGGSLLGRFARFGVVTTALFAVYDFFDGFFSASDILQKSANSIDWKDRVKVGFANIVSGLLSPIDWIAEKLGVDGGIFKGSRDEFTRKVIGVYDSIIESVEEVFDQVLHIFDKLKNFVSDQVMSKLPNWLTDWANKGPADQNTQANAGWMNFGWWGGQDNNDRKPEEEETPRSSEPNNKPVLDDYGPYTKQQFEESTSRANGAMNSTARKVANDGTGNNVDNSNSGNNTVVAPQNSQTNYNTNNFSRVADSHNNEPTHRRFIGGFLNLNY